MSTHKIGGSTIDETHPLDVNLVDDVARLLGRIALYDVLANGTLGALNEIVTIDATALSTLGIGISGTWVGTIVAEGTVGDGVWDAIPLVNQTLGSAALTTTANGNFLVGIAGMLTVRVRMSLYTSGTATVYIEGTAAPAGVFLSRSIPTGYNPIGSVIVTDEPTGDGTYDTSADSFATVGLASGGILGASATRTFAVIINDSANKIWLGFGRDAVVGSGVMLAPNGSYTMSAKLGNLWADTVTGIALAAGCNVSFHEGSNA